MLFKDGTPNHGFVCFLVSILGIVGIVVITAWCKTCLKHLPILFNLTNGEKQENFIYNG